MITRERKIVEKLCWCSQDGEPIVASGASLYEQGFVRKVSAGLPSKGVPLDVWVYEINAGQGWVSSNCCLQFGPGCGEQYVHHSVTAIAVSNEREEIAAMLDDLGVHNYAKFVRERSKR